MCQCQNRAPGWAFRGLRQWNCPADCPDEAERRIQEPTKGASRLRLQTSACEHCYPVEHLGPNKPTGPPELPVPCSETFQHYAVGRQAHVCCFRCSPEAPRAQTKKYTGRRGSFGSFSSQSPLSRRRRHQASGHTNVVLSWVVAGATASFHVRRAYGTSWIDTGRGRIAPRCNPGLPNAFFGVCVR